MLSCVGQIENTGVCVREEVKKLRQAIVEHYFDEMNKSSRTISDHVHRLAGHCNINLVNDSLRNWQGALKKRGTTELNAVSELLSSNYWPHIWLSHPNRLLCVTDWRNTC